MKTYKLQKKLKKNMHLSKPGFLPVHAHWELIRYLEQNFDPKRHDGIRVVEITPDPTQRAEDWPEINQQWFDERGLKPYGDIGKTDHLSEIKEMIKKRIQIAETSELNLRLGGYQDTSWPSGQLSVLNALLSDIEKIENEG